MEPSSLPEPQPIEESTGCLGAIAFYAAGLVLPLISAGYYRRAARRPLVQALLFLLLFGLGTAGISTLGLSYGLFKGGGSIQQAFTDGTMPDIVIQDGIARVKGPQPFIFLDDGERLIAFDTSGQIQSIDPRRYKRGILLTRTEIHNLDGQGKYQTLPLSQIHDLVNTNPIVINSQTTTQLWNQFSSIFSIGALVTLAIWNTLVRLLYLALLGLLIWGLASLFMGKFPYSAVLTIGVYASVPALYLHTLLGLVKVNFFLLHTLILGLIWLGVLLAAFRRRLFLLPEEPLRAWRAWMGLPMLAALIVNAVLRYPNGETIAWVLSVLTMAGLLTELFFRPESEPPPVPAADPLA